MNQKGVSFSKLLLDETDQAKTMRTFESSGAFSDWCAPTPVESSTFYEEQNNNNNNNNNQNGNLHRSASASSFNEANNNNSGNGGHRSSSYSSDRTWRFVLIGMCGGTMFSAVTSLAILALAGRGTSFQNFLHISLSPQQTRFMLIANLFSILFAASTASGVMRWFTRTRLSRLIGLRQQDLENFNNGNDEEITAAKQGDGVDLENQTSQDFFGHNNNNNSESNMMLMIEKKESPFRPSGISQAWDANDNKELVETNNNNNNNNNDNNNNSSWNYFSATNSTNHRAASALKGKKQQHPHHHHHRKQKDQEQHQNGDDEHDEEQELSPSPRVENVDEDNSLHPPSATKTAKLSIIQQIGGSAALTIENDASTIININTTTSTPLSPPNNLNSTSSNNKDEKVATAAAGTGPTFLEPTPLPQLPRDVGSNINATTAITTTTTSSIGNSRISSSHSTPARKNNQNMNNSSSPSSPSSPQKRDACTETQNEYFDQAPMQAPIFSPHQFKHHHQQQQHHVHGTGNVFLHQPQSTMTPASSPMPSSSTHNNHNHHQQQRVTILEYENNQHQVNDGSGSMPSSFASVMNDQVLKQPILHNESNNNCKAPIGKNVTNNSGLLLDGTSNVLQTSDPTVFSGDDGENIGNGTAEGDEVDEKDQTHCSNHPDLHIALPRSRRPSVSNSFGYSPALDYANSNNISTGVLPNGSLSNSDAGMTMLVNNNSNNGLHPVGNSFFSPPRITTREASPTGTPSSALASQLHHHQHHHQQQQQQLLAAVANEVLGSATSVPDMSAFVPHAFRTVDLAGMQQQLGLHLHNRQQLQPRSGNQSNAQTPREPAGGRTGNFGILPQQLQTQDDNNLQNQPAIAANCSKNISDLTAQLQNSASASVNGSFTGNNNSNQLNQNALSMMNRQVSPDSFGGASPQKYSVAGSVVDGCERGGSPHSSLLMANRQQAFSIGQVAAAAGDNHYKWWDNVSAATAATGTILSLHIGLMQDVQFQGVTLPEVTKNDIDSVSRLISIALEVGDGYGAVIDSFNLHWVIMSFNVLRPCPDHERLAALCALTIRTRFIALSSLMSPHSSPMTVAGSEGSPLTNPAVRPLVPFAIGLERGLVLGGHVGHGAVLRSFVLYGSPVERSRDLAVLGSTICGWMSPILVADTFNDLVSASCSSLLVDFVEFSVDPTGRDIEVHHPNDFDSPDNVANNNNNNQHEHDDNNNNNTSSPQPTFKKSASWRKQHHQNNRRHQLHAVVRVFDLYEEYYDEYEMLQQQQEQQHQSPFETHISPNEEEENVTGVRKEDSNVSRKSEQSAHNSASKKSPSNNFSPLRSGCLISPKIPKGHNRSASAGAASNSSKASNQQKLSAQEEMELMRIEITEEYNQAITLMRNGKLDDCLDSCAILEGRTMNSATEIMFSQQGSLNKTIASSAASPRIPVWLFQVKRHLSRLRRNVQTLISQGLEGIPYIRQSQARWVIFDGDNYSPSQSPLLFSSPSVHNNNNNSKRRRGYSPSNGGLLSSTLHDGDEGQEDRNKNHHRHHRQNNNNNNNNNLMSPSPDTDNMFDLTVRSAFLKNSNNNNNADSNSNINNRGMSRETDMDMTARSLKLLGDTQHRQNLANNNHSESMAVTSNNMSNLLSGTTSRANNKSNRKHPAEDSPSRMIAALQQQAAANNSTNNNNVGDFFSNLNNNQQQKHKQNSSNNNDSSSASSIPRPLSAGLLNSPEIVSNNLNPNNNNSNNNNNNPYHHHHPHGSGVISPSPNNMNDGIPELFQDYNGTWYRSSTKVLGAGAFGAVRLGIRTYDGILVAMKLLSLEEEEPDLEMSVTRRRRQQQQQQQQNNNNNNGSSAPTASKLDKIVAEIRLLTTLKNQNVVTLYTCAVVGTNVVLVLEYVSGGSLESLLKSFGSFDIASTQRYLKDVLRGLRYVHDRGYIHRDIKPGNILMQTDGSCKLADLGSSVAIKESLKRNIAVQGTPYFMAPESARGAAVSASDIWSVGIVACQLVSGQIPLRLAKDGIAGEVGLHRLLYHLAHEEVLFDFPEVVYREENLYSFIMDCLKPNPQDRPTAEQLLMHPFLMQQFRNKDVILGSATPSVSAARNRRKALHHSHGNNINNNNNNNNTNATTTSPSVSAARLNRSLNNDNNNSITPSRNLNSLINNNNVGSENRNNNNMQNNNSNNVNTSNGSSSLVTDASSAVATPGITPDLTLPQSPIFASNSNFSQPHQQQQQQGSSVPTDLPLSPTRLRNNNNNNRNNKNNYANEMPLELLPTAAIERNYYSRSSLDVGEGNNSNIDTNHSPLVSSPKRSQQQNQNENHNDDDDEALLDLVSSKNNNHNSNHQQQQIEGSQESCSGVPLSDYDTTNSSQSRSPSFGTSYQQHQALHDLIKAQIIPNSSSSPSPPRNNNNNNINVKKNSDRSNTATIEDIELPTPRPATDGVGTGRHCESTQQQQQKQRNNNSNLYQLQEQNGHDDNHNGGEEDVPSKNSTVNSIAKTPNASE